MAPRGAIFLFVEGEVPETRKTPTMTTTTTRRSLHSFLCEAVGLEHLDTTRYTAATDAGVSTLDAVNAIEITLRPRGKRR